MISKQYRTRTYFEPYQTFSGGRNACRVFLLPGRKNVRDMLNGNLCLKAPRNNTQKVKIMLIKTVLKCEHPTEKTAVKKTDTGKTASVEKEKYGMQSRCGVWLLFFFRKRHFSYGMQRKTMENRRGRRR